MKKIKLLIVFIGLLFIPFMCKAASMMDPTPTPTPEATQAPTTKVYVESVDVLEKSDGTIVTNPATFHNLKINFDVNFKDKDDYILYKIVIVNTSNKDYRITNTNKFKDSDYIKYDYIFNNDNNIVKAKSKQTMKIKITYQRVVPDDKLNADGSFTEIKKMIVSLSQGNGILSNPKTSSTIIALLVIVTIIVCTASIIGIKRKNKVSLLVIGVSLLVLPLGILAIESLQINVNSKVTISKESEFCVYDKGLTTAMHGISGRTKQGSALRYEDVIDEAYHYTYRTGMNFNEFKNSKYFNQVGNETIVDEDAFDYYDEGFSKLDSFFNTDDYNIGAYVKGSIHAEAAVINSDKIEPCDIVVYNISSKR